jgi:hypothetical protein
MESPDRAYYKANRATAKTSCSIYTPNLVFHFAPISSAAAPRESDSSMDCLPSSRALVVPQQEHHEQVPASPAVARLTSSHLQGAWTRHNKDEEEPAPRCSGSCYHHFASRTGLGGAYEHGERARAAPWSWNMLCAVRVGRNI